MKLKKPSRSKYGDEKGINLPYRGTTPILFPFLSEASDLQTRLQCERALFGMR